LNTIIAEETDNGSPEMTSKVIEMGKVRRAVEDALLEDSEIERIQASLESIPDL